MNFNLRLYILKKSGFNFHIFQPAAELSLEPSPVRHHQAVVSAKFIFERLSNKMLRDFILVNNLYCWAQTYR